MGRSSLNRFLIAAGLLICSPAWADTPIQTNQQSVAPAGGVTVQKGVSTTPVTCPDGQPPNKDGKCPLPVPVPANGNVDPTSTDSVKQPAMK